MGCVRHHDRVVLQLPPHKGVARRKPLALAVSPHFLTKDFTLKFFADRGIDFVDSFPVPLYPAITECMVFRKR
jgi:hypothetical protein